LICGVFFGTLQMIASPTMIILRQFSGAFQMESHDIFYIKKPKHPQSVIPDQELQFVNVFLPPPPLS